jgi:putative ABC transport system permease protein
VRSYVWRDLARNPRRTLASLAGITLGVALFASVLFFVDGSGATMTERAIAPLALDMQRVLAAPLGGGLRVEQRLTPAGALRRGQLVTVTLTVRNPAAVPANEVVVNDEPPAPLEYERATTRLDGRRLRDPAGQSPLAQGLARTGLNIGTVAPRSTVRLSYRARAVRRVPGGAALRLTGTVSSRENDVPVKAGAPPATDARVLRARIARIPGVAAADMLSFADLPPGSLRGAGGAVVRAPVRVFAFDRAYAAHYPSIRVVAGGWRPGAAMVSAEAARSLGAAPGQAVTLHLPGGRRPLGLRVGGVTDLARAKPLFYSRKTSRLEDFIYVPDSVVVSPELFQRAVVPAFRAASARPGAQLKSLPVTEVDVLVQRDRLRSDPASALAQTRAVARAVTAVAPGQDELIDNISNTLGVARADAAIGRRMFVFLGLPAILLAAFLTAYTGSIVAIAARREHAILRIRGAHRGHLLRMLAYRTVALAGAGAVAGAGLGLLSAMAVLGPDTLFAAPAGALLTSGAIAVGLGMLVTGLTLYVPGRRALRREISDERRELAVATPRERGALRAARDLALAAAAAGAGVLALRAARFEPSGGSVSEGRAVAAMPPRLLLAPLTLWFGGALVASQGVRGIASRLPLPAPPRFGPLLSGTLRRSLRRRARSLGTGIAGVALVVAFGTALTLFGDSYDAAKRADAAFVVGSDLRVTPSALDPRPRPPAYAARLEVAGVTGMTPVVSKLDNAVLIGPYDQDRATLTAIEPRSFERVAALADGFFGGGSAAGAMRALRADPRALLVEARAAEELSLKPGMRVRVLLARGTKRQRLERFRVAGLFERFPGFPQGTTLVANLHTVVAATRSKRVDFFLGKAAGGGDAGLTRAVAALRAGPARAVPLNIDTRATALDKDQSSLTALNVRGLVDLDTIYTLLMSGAVIAIFVFGLMLERRREYVILRAQGLRTGELRALVLGEAALVAAAGVAAGVAVGAGMAALLVRVLRPLFVLDPAVALPGAGIAARAGLAAVATLVTALAATALLRRYEPAELLREV